MNKEIPLLLINVSCTLVNIFCLKIVIHNNKDIIRVQENIKDSVKIH